MSQQINHGNVEREDSPLADQDTPWDAENSLGETASESVSEAEVLKKGSFSERWKTNRFWLVRGSYYFLHSVWMIVMAIGGFIAWLIAMLFI